MAALAFPIRNAFEDENVVELNGEEAILKDEIRSLSDPKTLGFHRILYRGVRYDRVETTWS